MCLFAALYLDCNAFYRTRGEREFRACWLLFLGVSWPFRSSFLAFSFLVFGSWALLVRALLVLVIASSGPGGFRLTRLLQIMAGELWLAG
jgi:hypothetical protein